MSTLNLDQKAAQYAQYMVNEAKNISGISKPIDTLERLVTKTLGVLQEQGVYAMMLFLFSRTGYEIKIAPCIRKYLLCLLKEIPAFFNGKKAPEDNAAAKEVLAFYSDNVCESLEILLLVKDLYEQTLIYARYGAKAEGQ